MDEPIDDKHAIETLRRALEATPCKCPTIKQCRTCGMKLVEGHDQFTGSWICPDCVAVAAPFKDPLKPCRRCAALANPAVDAVRRERERLTKDAAYLTHIATERTESILDLSKQLAAETARADRWHDLSVRQADELAAKDRMYAEMEAKHVQACKEETARADRAGARICELRETVDNYMGHIQSFEKDLQAAEAEVARLKAVIDTHVSHSPYCKVWGEVPMVECTCYKGRLLKGDGDE